MDKTALVIGSGQVFFDRFLSGTRLGTGERYLGNTTMFQIKREVGTIESRKSRGGVAVRDFRDVVSENTSIAMTTDNMNAENIADWFGATVTVETVTPSSVSESFTLKAGYAHQLGLSIYPMIGARGLDALYVTVDGEYDDGIDIDVASGRVYVPSNRTDLNGAVATVTYETRLTESKKAMQTSSAVRGALRFISKNQIGTKTNYYFPHVLLTPRDMIDFKAREWQSMTFDAEVLSQWVSYEIGVAGESRVQIAITGEGLTNEEFITVEDILDEVTNVIIPERGY